MKTITEHIHKKDGHIASNDAFLDIVNFLENICDFSIIVEEYYNKIIKVYIAGKTFDKLNIYIYYTRVLDSGNIDGYVVKVEDLDELERLLIVLYGPDTEEVRDVVREIGMIFGW